MTKKSELFEEVGSSFWTFNTKEQPIEWKIIRIAKIHFTGERKIDNKFQSVSYKYKDKNIEWFEDKNDYWKIKIKELTEKIKLLKKEEKNYAIRIAQYKKLLK